MVPRWQHGSTFRVFLLQSCAPPQYVGIIKMCVTFSLLNDELWPASEFPGSSSLHSRWIILFEYHLCRLLLYALVVSQYVLYCRKNVTQSSQLAPVEFQRVHRALSIDWCLGMLPSPPCVTILAIRLAFHLIDSVDTSHFDLILRVCASCLWSMNGKDI